MEAPWDSGPSNTTHVITHSIHKEMWSYLPAYGQTTLNNSELSYRGSGLDEIKCEYFRRMHTY